MDLKNYKNVIIKLFFCKNAAYAIIVSGHLYQYLVTCHACVWEVPNSSLASGTASKLRTFRKRNAGKVCESHGSTVWDVKYLVTVEQKDFSLLNGHKRPAQA